MKRYNILENDFDEDTERENRYILHNEYELDIYRIILEYVKGIKDEKINVTKKNIFSLLTVYLTDTEKILFEIVHSFYMPYFTQKVKELREKHKEYLKCITKKDKEYMKSIKKDLKNEEIELIYKLWVGIKIYKNV